LNKKQYKTLLVLTEVYRQQQWLFDNNKQSIEDRIVSLSQPHIRPIVRGKAGKSVEFGAKLSASCFEAILRTVFGTILQALQGKEDKKVELNASQGWS